MIMKRSLKKNKQLTSHVVVDWIETRLFRTCIYRSARGWARVLWISGYWCIIN